MAVATVDGRTDANASEEVQIRTDVVQDAATKAALGRDAIDAATCRHGRQPRLLDVRDEGLGGEIDQVTLDRVDEEIAIVDKLGFRQGTRDDKHIKLYINWYWIEFVSIASAGGEFQADAEAEPKGAGLYIAINVEDVDAYYQAALDAGLKPSSEPRDWPSGNSRREFVLCDPDGYKLVFFQKK